MYPSPCSHPVASSSSWSGVHIHVTAGAPFTSSHTGHSSTTAESASIRPLREPAACAGADPGRKPGVNGSAFTEVLRVNVRPFLHAHGVQCHARRQPRGESFPDVHGQGFTGGETPAVRELRQRVIDAAPVEPRGHFRGEQDVERRQAHHATRSEEHTSELQSRSDLVCRLLLEKKKKKQHAPPKRSNQLDI